MNHLLENLSIFDEFFIHIGSLNLFIYIFLILFKIIYIYKDSPKFSMDRILWIVTCLFVPYQIGFLSYIFIREFRIYKNYGENIEKKSFNFQFDLPNEAIKLLGILMLVLLLGIASGYSREVNPIYSINNSPIKIDSSSNTYNGVLNGFAGIREKELRFQKDGNLVISYSSRINGPVDMGIYFNNSPKLIFKSGETRTLSIPVKKHNIYKLKIRANDARGKFYFNWELK
ncbi:MAG: hypothetical protein N4A57_14070 [Anaeromicrobium sp.]|jgi:hypothetical protein|uniref:hypothetical protein n=1 Tax=Anaeromicrobium sp. TaxID=1929132 RepID=UPI0025EDD1C4|nr:hypothetical protein [Anaeromicrobium sp.]MCT4595373.1 hypothetical protein [Anaeromicrobium sp.]